MKKYKKTNKGTILITVLVWLAISSLFSSGLLSLGLKQVQLGQNKLATAQALSIAEAGINYYSWHLAHNQNDYQDGTGAPGPYVHDYKDPFGQTIGKFSLEITPPPSNSTIVTITSTGWTNSRPQTKRTVKARYGIPSLAHYSFLTNTDAWFGNNETTVGEIHSNGGMRMDGTNTSAVTSAKETYLCGPEFGCSPPQQKPAVWGAGPNSNLWRFPVPTVDFNIITIDLSNLKTKAQDQGAYYNTSAKGYHLVFKNNGTYDIFRVVQLESALRQLNDNWTAYAWIEEEIKEENLIGNYELPPNGIIFIEDNVWVEGIVKGNITLASARFPDNPNTNTSIIIDNNLQYLARDGSHRLGLIAQKNIKVPRHAPTDLIIDAMLLAQKGRAFRNLYYPGSRQVKNNIELYGGIITNKTWTWSWVDGLGIVVDGYQTTRSIYDPYLTYAPPPSFPTTSEYTFISWEEVN